MKIKKGDTVKILYGKDRSKSGSVIAVDEAKSQIIVSGLNIYKRHLKGDGRTRTSEILEIEKPLSTSKVMLICSECGKATRVSLKREGKKVTRICKKCGKEIGLKKEEVKKEEPKKEVKKKTTKSKKSTK